jgi:hypothetical protein
MSPDGLRVVYQAYPAGGMRSVVYADRERVDDPFQLVAPLENVPIASDLFMTADCGRIYFAGLGAISYVERD